MIEMPIKTTRMDITIDSALMCILTVLSTHPFSPLNEESGPSSGRSLDCSLPQLFRSSWSCFPVVWRFLLTRSIILGTLPLLFRYGLPLGLLAGNPLNDLY